MYDWKNFVICLDVLLEDIETRAFLTELVNQRNRVEMLWVKMKLAQIELELEERKKNLE